ncbi:MAG: MFS transporter [Anaerolineaceae bacterium]|nr:MFS transporter [Anaerolineaceae bacterium]
MIGNLPRSRLFWAVSSGHMVNDIFMSMGPVLLAFMSVYILPISHTQIGLAVGLSQLMGALSQPLFGWLADRNGGRWLGAGGVAWTGSLLLLALFAAQQTGQFWLMVIPFAAMALGSGAFHPVGAMYASESDPHHAARDTSIFFFMGQSGLALGPALVGALLNSTLMQNNVLANNGLNLPFPSLGFIQGSISPVYFIGLLLVPVSIFMVLALPSGHTHRQARSQATTSAAQTARRGRVAYKPILLLIVLVTLRSLAQPGSVAFIPVLFQQKGWNAAQYGLISSSFWLASGLAGIYIGSLADRFQRRYVIAITLVLSGPAFFLLPGMDGLLAFAFAIAAGGLSGATHSLIVVLGQELLPLGKAMASGIALGFIFATGAIGTLVIGNLSDVLGVETAFHLVAVSIVVAGVLAFGLPAGRRVPAPVAPQPATS